MAVCLVPAVPSVTAESPPWHSVACDIVDVSLQDMSYGDKVVTVMQLHEIVGNEEGGSGVQLHDL